MCVMLHSIEFLLLQFPVVGAELNPQIDVFMLDITQIITI